MSAEVIGVYFKSNCALEYINVNIMTRRYEQADVKTPYTYSNTKSH